MKQVAAAVCLSLMVCGALAQPIYRCGTEYSQTPCPGGKMLESSDSRTAAQRAEAVRVAAEDRRRAAQLERERRALERSTRPAAPTGFNGRPQPSEPAAPRERGKVKKKGRTPAATTTDFVAVEPAKPKSPAGN